MEENTREDRMSVYEIGYLVASSVAEEKVAAEADKVRKIIADAGSTVIAEEAPQLQDLSYTMRVKEVSGAYRKYDQAYFGWIKFEAATDKVEGVKKAIEVLPSIVRMLMITTVRENTYLGKRAPGAQAKLEEKPVAKPAEAAAAPATIEDMDKSIDDMVKEV